LVPFTPPGPPLSIFGLLVTASASPEPLHPTFSLGFPRFDEIGCNLRSER